MDTQVQRLIKLTVGDYLTVTGPDSRQCSAVPHYFERLLGLPIVYGNAVDTYENAPDDLYDKVLYKPGLVPSPGAIMVWGAPYGRRTSKTGIPIFDGHTAVVVSVSGTRITVVSQNDPTGSAVVLKTYPLSPAVVGWFTPKEDNVFEGRTAQDWAIQAKDAEAYKQQVITSVSWEKKPGLDYGGGMAQNVDNVRPVIDSLESFKAQVLADPALAKLDQIRKIVEG